MAHRDRAGDASGQRAGQRAGQRVGQRAGRRAAAGPAGHRQGFPTPAPIRPLPVRLGDRNGGFPRLSARGRTARGFQTGRMASDVPHRRATRSWPKALGNRFHESLSALLGITRRVNDPRVATAPISCRVNDLPAGPAIPGGRLPGSETAPASLYRLAASREKREIQGEFRKLKI